MNERELIARCEFLENEVAKLKRDKFALVIAFWLMTACFYVWL